MPCDGMNLIPASLAVGAVSAGDADAIATTGTATCENAILADFPTLGQRLFERHLHLLRISKSAGSAIDPAFAWLLSASQGPGIRCRCP